MSLLETNQIVYSKHKEEGWLPATVESAQEVGGDRSAVLRLESGDRVHLKGLSSDDDKWCLADQQSLLGTDDMVKMDALTEGSVLHNLRVRYRDYTIYTAVGSILVAVNPYQPLPRLYDEARMRVYSAAATDATPPPHPYHLMELAYRGLVSDRASQSILISGESGAGKTETTKYLLQYLSVRAGDGGSGGSVGVAEAVVQQNPVMEAFANAKTSRNNNSSRFGKYIKVELGGEGGVCGGHVTTYLLEKMRVVQQLPGERNYHVFYQLCAGANAAAREELGLEGGAESFALLTGGGCTAIRGVDDAAGYRLLQKCLGSLGLGEEARESLVRVLAAVLHLGNINFDPLEIRGQDAGSSIAGGLADVTLQHAARLLGVPPEKLVTSLTVALIGNAADGASGAGGGGGGRNSNFSVSVPLNVEAARAARDAVAKAIYAAAFSWLVGKLTLPRCAVCSAYGDSSSDTQFIGILDIFGFEAFGTNSLEQLLINYANERLQQQFNFFVFKLEEQEFQAEGLSAVYVDECRVEWTDNSEILSLLEAKPMGLLSLLNEEATLKNGTSENLVKRYRQGFDGAPCFCNRMPVRGGATLDEAIFGVRHFAGEVYYTVTGFVEKNRDAVPVALADLVLDSSDRFVSQIVLYCTVLYCARPGELWGTTTDACRELLPHDILFEFVRFCAA
ncbi:P-loop containing nucleoside triphosphate hydrolase protein [Tribonema minus]|uniref:P-loop containing nucleoside triphosphate hydrolase protein n=1 Tax=Tribonema minus TaxID=303371 RepID=A0A835YVE9_9STRA|nr:P-loop containing nucleoside triphosphate hydrolase protein [Tribonema minus]